MIKMRQESPLIYQEKKSPPLFNYALGDVIFVVTDDPSRKEKKKWGIYSGNGLVVYLSPISKGSWMCKVVCEEVNLFSEGYHVQIGYQVMNDATFDQEARKDRAIAKCGTFWSEQINPSHSFVKWVCMGDSTKMSTYKYSLAGGVLGFYLGGPTGVAIGVGVGWLLDQTKGSRHS